MSAPRGVGAARGRRWLRAHLAVYLAAVGAMNVVNVIGGAPWWAFWPTMVWGVALAVHFFVFKSLTIDSDWVDERASELREHSYDFDHMKDIERRIVERDFSVEPRSDREKR